MLLFIVEYVIPSLGLIAIGAVLEAKFGGKVAAKVQADMAEVQADVAAAHARVSAVEAAVTAKK